MIENNIKNIVKNLTLATLVGTSALTYGCKDEINESQKFSDYDRLGIEDYTFEIKVIPKVRDSYVECQKDIVDLFLSRVRDFAHFEENEVGHYLHKADTNRDRLISQSEMSNFNDENRFGPSIDTSKFKTFPPFYGPETIRYTITK